MTGALGRRLLVALCLGVALVPSCAAAKPPKVVASLPPIHSLVAGVMLGIGEPALIVRGYGSPHAYQMRPSDAARLGRADVVFWVGEALETFLAKPLATLGRDARVVELMGTAGLTLHRNRAAGAWPAEDDEHGEAAEHAHHPTAYDAHIWLDVRNATRLVGEIVRHLCLADPTNAGAYQANGERLQRRLDALDRDLEDSLGAVKDVPYVVFHDAYQYLEKRYRLNAVGSITVGPDQLPGARRLSELRLRIRESGTRCVFREPQFRSALIETVVEGTDAGRGVLDPLGTAFAPGPEAYFQMMQANAAALVDCLGRQS